MQTQIPTEARFLYFVIRTAHFDHSSFIYYLELPFAPTVKMSFKSLQKCIAFCGFQPSLQ